MTNKIRRELLQVVWASPAVSFITSPVHAQTSLCSFADLVGTWQFMSATHLVPDLYPTFTLNDDGTTSDAASEWRVSGTRFILSHDVSDYVFIAELSADCSSLAGTSTTQFIDTLPPNGIWSAVKVV